MHLLPDLHSKGKKTSQTLHVIAVFQYLFAAALLQNSLEALEMVCFLDLMARDLNCFYHASASSHLLSREQQIWENKEMNKELHQILESFRNDDGNGYDNARKQWYDWINGAECDTLASIFLWRGLQNINVKHPKVSERSTIKFSFTTFTSTALAPIHLQHSLSTR